MDGRSSFTATADHCPKQRILLHDEFKETLVQDSKIRKSSPTEWTNEKHSMYLKSIEASFVEELYSSLDMFGFHSQEEKTLHPMSSHRRKQHDTNDVSSGQYKVLRDGCWGKIEFGSQKAQLNKANRAVGLSQNPWIRHFRPTNANKAVTSCGLQEEKCTIQYPEVPVYSKLALNPVPLRANSDLCCDTEGTDQNFEEDSVDSEMEVSKACNAKKMKTFVAATTTSSKNQVVPVGNYSNAAVNLNRPSSERMELVEDSFVWRG